MSAAAYLENQVLTATPQKLRLMLIDGALRFAQAALRHWQEGRDEDASEAIIRCRAIVTELFSVVRPADFEPAGNVIAAYVFLFRELTEAQARRDADRVRGAIAVLEEDRETWRRLCEQLPEAPLAPAALQPQEVTLSNFLPAGPSAAAATASAAPPGAGFSLDA